MKSIQFSEINRCPNCESGRIRRSRRRGLVEKVACAVLLVSPYRCEECDQRYFRFRTGKTTFERLKV